MSHNPHNSVCSLRRAGATVHIDHYRLTQSTGEMLPRRSIAKGDFAGKGGITRAHIVLANGQELKGEAVCSKRDNFCYRSGLAIALQRAFDSKKQESVEPGEDKVVLKVTPNSFAAIPA